MTEEQVYVKSRRMLADNDWAIIGGQAPGGSHDIPLIEIKDPARVSKGSKGAFKPDLVCYRNGIWLLVEAKPLYNSTDRRKLLSILADSGRLESFADELEQRSLLSNRERPESSNVFGALAYSGPWRNADPIGAIVVDAGVLRLCFTVS